MLRKQWLDLLEVLISLVELLCIDVVAVSHFIHFMIFARVDNFVKSVIARGLASKGHKFEEAPL